MDRLNRYNSFFWEIEFHSGYKTKVLLKKKNSGVYINTILVFNSSNIICLYR